MVLRGLALWVCPIRFLRLLSFLCLRSSALNLLRIFPATHPRGGSFDKCIIVVIILILASFSLALSGPSAFWPGSNHAVVAASVPNSRVRGLYPEALGF